jgi:hypothetical protein
MMKLVQVVAQDLSWATIWFRASRRLADLRIRSFRRPKLRTNPRLQSGAFSPYVWTREGRV